MRALTISFYCCAAAALLFTAFAPWPLCPVPDIAPFFPGWDGILFNLKDFLHGRGTYFNALRAAVFFIAVSALFFDAGRILLKILAPEMPSQISSCEFLSVSWLAGSGIFSLAWFTLSLLGLFKKGVALGLVLAGCLLLVRTFVSRQFRTFAWREVLPESRFEQIIFGFLCLGIVSWSALSILPQYYWDTLMINEAIPNFFALESHLAINPFHIYSYFPQNSELLTAWMLLAGSREAAVLLVWGFFAALIVFLYGWLGRTASKTAALIALTAFASSQLAPWLCNTLKNDLQTGAFLILAWWGVFEALRAREHAPERTAGWLTLSGFFGGIACGHKFTAAPSILVTFLGIFFAFRRLRSVLAFALGLFVAWGPWLLLCWARTGNPVYPFLMNSLGQGPLYPWHSYAYNPYSIQHQGSAGFAEYARNLMQFKPAAYGGAKIWWGPSGWICTAGTLSVFPWFRFNKEKRWTAGIALSSLLISLFFALKPPYHCGPLILLFCAAFAWTLQAVFFAAPRQTPRAFAWIVVLAAAIRSFWISDLKAFVLLGSSILATGAPPHYFMPSMQVDTPAYASVDEIEWINRLIGKYSAPEDKVLFVGTVRPALVPRKHLAAFSLGMQPILDRASKSANAAGLNETLLREGYNQIVFDRGAWNDWLNNNTPDGPHNLNIPPADLYKVKEFAGNFLSARFQTPSGRLAWLSIRQGQELPQILPDPGDIYEFPFQYLQVCAQLWNEGRKGQARQLLGRYSSVPLSPKLRQNVEKLSQSFAAAEVTISQ